MVSCQECKFRSDPNAVACSKCGLSGNPETIKRRKRKQNKITLLTLGYFMVFIIPFSLLLIFDGMSNGDIQGGGNPYEIALGSSILLIAFIEIGYVNYLLFLKKK